MNILPKKKWHVRTKDNIARVRRDEANALKEEQDTLKRAQIAEQEARTSFLREKARHKLEEEAGSGGSEEITTGQLVPTELPTTTGHVSFITESEKDQKSWGTNKERAEEEKQEKEKYEKSIGLLTYLGQSVLEEKDDRPWYTMPRVSSSSEDPPPPATSKSSAKERSRNLLDPLNDMRKYLKMIEGPPEMPSKIRTLNTTVVSVATPQEPPRRPLESKKMKKKHSKKRKKSHKRMRHRTDSTSDGDSQKKSRKRRRNSSDEYSTADSDVDTKKLAIEKLRAARLAREREERAKAERLLSKLSGDASVDKAATSSDAVPDDSRCYNSQFNPHLAKKRRLNN